MTLLIGAGRNNRGRYSERTVQEAQRFKDTYYLYAVMNAATLLQLYMVRDPAETLAPEERVEMVRYVVGAEEIKDKGDRAL